MDFHPGVDTDRFPPSEIEMVLEHGRTAQQSGGAEKRVYGYLAVVLANDRVIAAFERDQINDVEFYSYDEIDKHYHFLDRVDERDLYEHEVRSVVDCGVMYYNQYTWYYLGDVNGHLVKIVRDGDQLKSVYWYNENPRGWQSRDSLTDTYMRRRHARKMEEAD